MPDNVRGFRRANAATSGRVGGISGELCGTAGESRFRQQDGPGEFGGACEKLGGMSGGIGVSNSPVCWRRRRVHRRVFEGAGRSAVPAVENADHGFLIEVRVERKLFDAHALVDSELIDILSDLVPAVLLDQLCRWSRCEGSRVRGPPRFVDSGFRTRLRGASRGRTTHPGSGDASPVSAIPARAAVSRPQAGQGRRQVSPGGIRQSRNPSALGPRPRWHPSDPAYRSRIVAATMWRESFAPFGFGEPHRHVD